MTNTSQKAHHTEGPWKVNVDGCGDTFISGANDEYVADLGAQGDDPVRLKADAHLIATAPDLLAILERILPPALCGESWNLPHGEKVSFLVSFGDLAEARAAIAKAKGGAA